MRHNEDRLSEQQVDDIAHYFATWRSLEIKFADADLADYLLYLIERKMAKRARRYICGDFSVHGGIIEYFIGLEGRRAQNY